MEISVLYISLHKCRVSVAVVEPETRNPYIARIQVDGIATVIIYVGLVDFHIYRVGEDSACQVDIAESTEQLHIAGSSAANIGGKCRHERLQELYVYLVGVHGETK